MRPVALILALCATVAFAAEGDEPAPAPAPVPAPAGDAKAQLKELDMKIKAIREQTIKDDAELGKLKTEADDARKRYEAAVESKLMDNADYQAIKAQINELKGKGKNKNKDKNKDEKKDDK